MSSRTIKLVHAKDVRRVRLSAAELTHEGLYALAYSVFNLKKTPDASIVCKYDDGEGDRIRLGSDADVREMLLVFGDDKTPRILVTYSDNESDDVEDDNEAELEAMYDAKEDDDEPDEADAASTPFDVVSSFLTDESNVRLLQQAIASPLLASTVSKFAATYGSDPGAVFARVLTEGENAFAEEIGTVRAVFESALAEHPEVVRAVYEMAQGRGLLDGVGFFQAPSSQAGRGADVFAAQHRTVICDGCAADRERARAATAAGTRDASNGHIVGPRFNSTTTRDYDVCATCEATGDFDAEHGPFLYLKEPRVGRGRCGPPHRGPRCGSPHRWGPPPHHRRHPHGRGPEPHRRGPCGGPRRGCRGSRRGDAFKKSLLDVASEFVDHFSEAADEMLGRDTAKAIKASLEAMKAESSGPADEEPVTQKRTDLPKATAAPAVIVEPPVAKRDDDENDSWTEVAAAERPADSEDPMVRWTEQLRVLNAIGYDDDLDLAIRLLEEEDGNLERVVARVASVRA